MNFKISDYEHIIDNFQSAIVIFDKDLNLLHINKAGKQLLNINNEISNLKDLLSPIDLSIIKQQSSIFINKKTEFNINYLNKKINVKSSYLELDDKSKIEISNWYDYTSVYKDDLLKNCVFDISQASHYAKDLNTLYEKIHNSLKDIIETKNFYIAMADWENNIIHFPYFVDQFDETPKSKLIEKGLTEYVLKKGDSILVNPEQYDQLVKAKKISMQGRKALDWLA